jgi:hypothetical protein
MSDGCTQVTNSDLPAGMTDQFTKNVLSIIHDTSDALLPWDAPGNDLIIEIWNLVFENKYPIVDSVKDKFFPLSKA